MKIEPKITILAGGNSTRMGRDKARIEYRGESLLRRIARRASSVADEVCIAGRTCPEDWPLPHIRFLPDRAPDRGPLEGLLCALMHFRSPTALVACDMPLLSADALAWLLSTHRTWYESFLCSARSHGLVIERDGEPEPLFSVYHPAASDLVKRRLSERKRSLRGLIREGDFATRTVPEPFADQLRNVNTPEDLDQLP